MALQDEVITLVSQVIKVPVRELDAESGLGTVPNWDSLSHTSLVLALEEAFDIGFDFDELDQIVTVGAITRSLEAKGVSR
jgi:acyl carrier protein